MSIKFSDVSDILTRMQSAYGVSSNAQLAELMGVPASTANNWASRDSLPGSYIIRCALDTGADLQWLVSGELKNASLDNPDRLSEKGKDLYERVMNNGGKPVLSRMLRAYGFSMQKELGDLFGISSGTMSAWIRREYFPGDVVVACALDTGVSLQWLATGDGDIYLKNPVSAPNSNTLDIPSYCLESGKLKEEPAWNIDYRLISDNVKLPCYIRNGQTGWIVDKGITDIVNGRWLLIIDGYYDVYDITRMPNNQIQVGLFGTDSKFICNLNDVGCVGQIVFTIEKNK